MKNLWILTFASLLCLSFEGKAQRQDQAGSSDHPLLNRFEDFYIRKYTEDEFAAHSFATSRNEKKQIEGKKIFIRYEIQPDKTKPSPLQIVRNYSNAIAQAGGEVIYEHPKAEFATYFVKTSASKNIWISVVTAPDMGRRYSLFVVEENLMKQEIVLNADLIKQKIDLEGKVALYGILFDTGKSTIKSESAEALEQIGLYLIQNPDVNCWVVGHTDTVGAFETNMNLSADRARAVKNYLETNHDIEPERLASKGIGPLSPVAANDSEEGKMLNRRVELVKKP